MNDPPYQEFLSATAVRQAHALVGETVVPGDLAIDATCGNGFDTAFLAGLTGESGHVFAFDIQPAAIEATTARLERDNLSSRVTLHTASHGSLKEYLPGDLIGRFRAVMFNLGYLPGSDRTVRTHPQETVPALISGAEVLRDGGIMTVVVYTGHDGGAEEALEVEQALSQLDRNSFDVRSVGPLNRAGNPPYLIAVYKRR